MRNDADSRLTRKVVSCLVMMLLNYGLIMLPKGMPWYFVSVMTIALGNVFIAWHAKKNVEDFESSEHYIFLTRLAKYSVALMIGIAATLVAVLAFKGKLVNYSIIFFVFGTFLALVAFSILDESLSKKLDKNVF